MFSPGIMVSMHSKNYIETRYASQLLFIVSLINSFLFIISCIIICIFFMRFNIVFAIINNIFLYVSCLSMTMYVCMYVCLYVGKQLVAILLLAIL